jgi:SPP1 gp7 family putative phage head morphogenesis protein
VIHAQKGVSDRHALFIAKQEISLMTTTYRDSRNQEAGINEWVWSSSHDSRVRPLHRKLDGHKFSYTNLPIIDEKTGEKGTPGKAFGCRCQLIPLLNTDKYINLGTNKDKSIRFSIKS